MLYLDDLVYHSLLSRVSEILIEFFISAISERNAGLELILFNYTELQLKSVATQ